jgi:XRE family aerobic/anaerobic benzoate catabolism transcriptional regulator
MRDRLLLDLGRRVREERERRGLSRRELAERSGLSLRFLTLVESGRGNISVRKLSRLAGALSKAPAALLEDAGGLPGRPVISLLGLRGAGKTTIGRRLARKLRIPFVELDERVEKLSGLPLAEIFRLHGEGYYRRLEGEALERLLRSEGALVLATGGGLVTSPETYARLRQRAVTVWLRARPEDHWSRVVQQGDRRPMEARPSAMTELRRLLAVREPLYSQAAHAIDTSRLDVDQAVRAIEDVIEPAVDRGAAAAPRDLPVRRPARSGSSPRGRPAARPRAPGPRRPEARRARGGRPRTR